jgi:hypothetical protein
VWGDSPVNVFINYLIAKRAVEIYRDASPQDEEAILRGIKYKESIWDLDKKECKYLTKLIEKDEEYPTERSICKILLERLYDERLS